MGFLEVIVEQSEPRIEMKSYRGRCAFLFHSSPERLPVPGWRPVILIGILLEAADTDVNQTLHASPSLLLYHLVLPLNLPFTLRHIIPIVIKPSPV